MAARSYDELSRDDLIDIINRLKRRKRYGLVWEEEKVQERFDEEARNAYPILKAVEERDVLTNPKEPVNLLIEGDNLHTLSVLNYTHQGSIDIIYIDPPYNTGNKDFKYNDHWADKEDVYRHSKWLSFMKPRLQLARNLLKDTGVIFVSIDDNEFAQLKLLMDEVFEESNYITTQIWVKNAIKNNVRTLSVVHEYILTYARSKSSLVTKGSAFAVSKPGINEVFRLRDDFLHEDLTLYESPHKELEQRLRKFYRSNKHLKGISHYKFVEPETLRIYAIDNISAPGGNGKQYDIIHPVTGKPCKRPAGGYRFTEKTMRELLSTNQIHFGKDETTVPRFKRYLDTVEMEVPKSVINNNDDGTRELQSILNETSFSYPKPTSLIKYLIQVTNNPNAIVLDFFAGSGTTGHAVLQLNKEDGGNRQFILVTNNENNICTDVCYPRIQKVIHGYTTPKGKEVPGLGGNLKYYRVGLVAKLSNSDEMKV